MFISKIFSSKAADYGKQVAKNKVGTRVFKKEDAGIEIITSLDKKGNVIKVIEKENLVNKPDPGRNIKSIEGHITKVKNNRTGESTYIKKANVITDKNYNQYSVYFPANWTSKEFLIEHTKGKDWDSKYFIKRGDFEAKGTQKFKDGGYLSTLKTKVPKCFESYLIQANNYKMPSGKTLTGEFGRKKEYMADGTILNYSINRNGNYQL